MLSLLLLGPPLLSLDGQPLTALRRKNRALLYVLARRDTPLSRDEALAFLWPDHPRPSAQRILRTMLSELRRQLGPALLAEAESLAFAPETVVDTRRFEADINAPRASANTPALSATLELYRGDFLQGFSLADPPEFDDWVAAQREHFRTLAIRGLASLAQLHEQQTNYAAALGCVTRALAFDPLQEDLQRAALRLHYRLGDRAAAIRRYEALRRQLDEELGVPPSPETRALYDALITDSPSLLSAQAAPEVGQAPPSQTLRFSEPLKVSTAIAPVPPPAASPPLLPFTGRAAELARIQQASERGLPILIEGEPGIGKTRLAEEFLSQPGLAGRIVLRGAAYESEQGLPYQPIVDALRGLLALPDWPALRPSRELAPGWLAEVARLLPELLAEAPSPAGAPSSVEEARMWEGLSQFLQSLARRRPVTLLLDDLHWADAATVGLLGYLARRAASPALAVLATARPVAAETGLGLLRQALAHEGRLARVLLAPLTPDDTRRVASRLSPGQSDAAHLAGWLGANAEGNPYFLTELVRFAQHGGLLRADGTLDRQVLDSAPILPATVENLIRSRLIRLSPGARRALEVAAVAGREFDFELVQAVAGQSESEALDALDELRAAGLIRPHAGGQYVFDHSLTMEVAYRDMGEQRFRVLHRRAAEALEARRDSAAGTIAYHFARAGVPGRAGPHAFRAGQRSAALAAWAPAIAFYQQALQAGPSVAESLAIRLAIGEARFHSGDFVGATDDYRAAIELAETGHDLSSLEAAYLALNVALLPQARYAESIALGRELRRSGPPELAVCAEFIWAAALSVESAHPVEAEYHVREAERLLSSQAPGASRVSLAQIKYQLAGIVGQQGRAAESVALYREALDLTLNDQQTLDLLRQIMLYNNLAYQLHLLGQQPAAAEYAQAGIKLAQERGSLTHLSYLLSTSGEIALAQGDLDLAETYFNEGLALARQVPIAERIAGHTANLGLVAIRRGQAELARTRLRDALVQAQAVGGGHLSVRIRLWLAPLVPPEEAAGLLREARAAAEEAGYFGLLEEISRLEQTLTPG
jgi:DNA-binding SARP family transcriptional activator/predicted ATPase